ncbi:hypothetical protein BaRGS_00001167 [Batillaria attramentaria]|uniref:Uncharacterized protein n=1 Tax=Batillaria attramentaria TaxID=370345 RepID=A0ABD0M6U7_9CAEN
MVVGLDPHSSAAAGSPFYRHWAVGVAGTDVTLLTAVTLTAGRPVTVPLTDSHALGFTMYGCRNGSEFRKTTIGLGIELGHVETPQQLLSVIL